MAMTTKQWAAIARERLTRRHDASAGLSTEALAAEVEPEFVDELAAHLAQAYEEARRDGQSDEESRQAALRLIERRCTISGSRGRNDHVAPPRKPHRGIPEFDDWEETAFPLIEGYPMVHDHERKRAVAHGAHHIGDGGCCDGDRPHFLLDRRTSGPLLGGRREGRREDDRRVAGENT